MDLARLNCIKLIKFPFIDKVAVCIVEKLWMSYLGFSQAFDIL